MLPMLYLLHDISGGFSKHFFFKVSKNAFKHNTYAYLQSYGQNIFSTLDFVSQKIHNSTKNRIEK